MEKNFVGYLLEALDPEETRAVEAYLDEHPEAHAHLQRLRAALAPLDADIDDDTATDDLCVRTLATVAEHVVRTEARPTGHSESKITDFIRSYSRLVIGVDVPDGRSMIQPSIAFSESDSVSYREARRNVIAAFGLTLAFLALLIPAVLTIREHQQVIACQNNLRLFHQSLSGYASERDGQLPRVGEEQKAGSFVTALAKSGWLSPDARPTCAATGHGGAWTTSRGEPVSEAAPGSIEYAYTLGYFDENGKLVGLNRQSDSPTLAVMADAPVPVLPRRLDGTSTAANHRRGQNVLFLDGSARFCTNALVGIDGDNIYCNQVRRVNAGINSRDTVLGRADEKP